MQNVYFILVTHNAMKWAERSLGSLRKSSVPVECIIVDNGSTDGTQEFIKQNFKEYQLIESSENLGFGKANNLGIEVAYKKGADFFYLMNQDAWIFEDTIETLLDSYYKYPQKEEIGILSPMHLDGSGENLDIFLDKYIATNFEHTRMISDFYLKKVKKYYEIKFINAAHWFLPKATIEKIGGFNPFFFHYGEDNEYINRVTYHKMKVLLIPSCRAVHDGKQDLNKVNYYIYKNQSIETNIMNPSLQDQYNKEIDYLKQSMLKNFILRDFSKCYILAKKN